MSFANKLRIPYTVYGGLSTVSNAGVDTLSGYTNKLTTFQFIASTSYPSYDYVSSDKFLWDFGDGTTSTSTSASHVYRFPGVYNVSLVAYDSGGDEYISTEVKQLSVTDFYPDRLLYAGGGITATLNIPANIRNATKTPIVIERRNTHQLHESLSGNDYTVNLYASGSNSYDRSTMLEDKWLHLDKTWSFYTVTTADNGVEQLTGITSISSSSEDIYYRKYNKFQSEYIERVPLANLTDYPEAVFVGTSGNATFYYGDTLPIVTEEPVFAFCSLDTSQIPEYRDILSGKSYRSVHIDDVHLPSMYNSLDLVLPLRIRYRPAKSLTFTTAGIKSLGYPDTVWQNSTTSFFVDLLDQDENVVMSYAGLSGKQAVDGQAPTTTTYVTNLSVVSANTTNLSDASVSTLLSAHFYRNTSFGLPSVVNSKFSGQIIPYDVGDNVHLVGECNLYTEPHFSKDTVLYGISNKDTKEINIGIANDKYLNQEKGVQVINNITFEKHSVILPFINEPSLTFYHTSTSYTDNEQQGIFTGTKHDSISSINTYSQILSSITLSGINDSVNRELPGVNTNIVSDYHHGNNSHYLTPIHSAISNKKEKTAWVLLSGACVAMEVSFEQSALSQYSYSNQPTIENVVRVSDNLVYETTTNNVPDNMIQGPGGTHSLLIPTLIDVDINNDLWLGFTNSVSGCVRKYETNTQVDLDYWGLLEIIHPPLADFLLWYYSEDNTDTSWTYTESQVKQLLNNLDEEIVSHIDYYGIDIVAEYSAYNLQNLNKLATTVEFDHPHTIPTDIITTNKGDCWISTRDADPSVTGYDVTIAAGSVSALSATNDTVKYEFTAQEIDALSAGHVAVIDGFSSADKYYNGTFLITDIDRVGDSITVKPFRGKVNNLTVRPNLSAEATSGTLKAYTDHVYKVDSSGTILHNVSGFFRPTYICTDRYQNLWVAHDTNTITKVTSAGLISTSIKVETTAIPDMYASAGATFAFGASADDFHIGGITFDTYNNMYVVNAYESKLYRIPIDTPSLSSAYTISTAAVAPNTTHSFPFGRHTARGDWNGYRWLNKFDNTVGTSTVSGHVTFNIYPSGGKYSVAKINEKFDPIETIKTYRSQPILVENGKVLFDDLYGTIVGNISSDPTAIGRTVYEKIANFTDNVSDPVTCNVKALYSLCNMVDINLANYNFDYSGGLHRIMNIISMPHKTLWGERSRFDRDFETYGTVNSAYGTNLGTELSILTAMVSAGTPIVARQLYNNQHTKIHTMQISGSDYATNMNTVWGEISAVTSDVKQTPATVNITYSFVKAGTVVHVDNYGLTTVPAVTVQDQSANSSVTHAEFVQEIVDAFQQWKALFEYNYPWLTLNFVNLGDETGTSQPVSHSTNTYSLPHADNIGDMRIVMHQIDGSGGADGDVLAYGYTPAPQGDSILGQIGNWGGNVHFDSAQNWRLDDFRNRPGEELVERSIKSTAIHEIGHALGFGHNKWGGYYFDDGVFVGWGSIMQTYAFPASWDNVFERFPLGLSAVQSERDLVYFTYPRPDIDSSARVYPLSTYNSAWGWGLGQNITSDNLSAHYVFYEFVSTFADNQLEGMLDWSNPLTTVSETISGIDEWSGDGNIVDTMINYELRRGLGLFNTNISAANTNIL